MTRSSSHRLLWELRKYKHSFVLISSCCVKIRHRGKWGHECELQLFWLKQQGLLSQMEEWTERMWQFSEHWKFLSWALFFHIPRFLASLDLKNLNKFSLCIQISPSSPLDSKLYCLPLSLSKFMHCFVFPNAVFHVPIRLRACLHRKVTLLLICSLL